MYSLLVCPRCRGTKFETDSAACADCGLDLHRRRGGFLDLIDVATIGEPTAATTEQRFMESDVVAHAYDRIWRPIFVRMLAGKGAGASVGGIAGEMFIAIDTVRSHIKKIYEKLQVNSKSEAVAKAFKDKLL